MASSDYSLRIYVEQLRGGKTWTLDVVVPPDFLDVHESELVLSDPVRIEGEAYLAQDELIIQADLETQAQVPCRICNKPFKVPLRVEKWIHVEPIGNLKRGYYDIGEIVREALLLEVPYVAECHGGNCPSRQEIAGYLQTEPKPECEHDEGYNPFHELYFRPAGFWTALILGPAGLTGLPLYAVGYSSKDQFRV